MTTTTAMNLDSSKSPVHGAQEGSAYNGHFESVCYHPLFLFNEHGDCVAATLRPGNVHSADDWDDLLVPEIERQQAEGTRVAFRADAAFAKPADRGNPAKKRRKGAEVSEKGPGIFGSSSNAG